MGDVIAFRAKRLSGFIPDPDFPGIEELALGQFPKWPAVEPVSDDRACSEINPEDCA